MREMRNAHKILAGKSEVKRPFGRPWCRFENYIIIYLIEMRREDVDWIRLAQDRDHWRVLVNTIMRLRVP
jgi:hypothetical protein